MFEPRHLVLLLMIAIAAASRVVEHPWNLAPVGALALFAGAHFRDRRLAFAVPLVAMFVSDIALGLTRRNVGFYTFHPLLPLIYACYALYVLLGEWIRRSWRSMDGRAERRAVGSTPPLRFSRAVLKAVPVASATLVGAVMFFVLTNFGDWLLYYDRTWTGLVNCYTAAIPFFRNTLAGDAAYVAILFGGYSVLKQALGVQVFESERA
jgi:hypothetical protein